MFIQNIWKPSLGQGTTPVSQTEPAGARCAAFINSVIDPQAWLSGVLLGIPLGAFC